VISVEDGTERIDPAEDDPRLADLLARIEND